MSIVLYGAGSGGRYCLNFLRERGVDVSSFADNEPAKWGMEIDGVKVRPTFQCRGSDTWVCSAISRPAASQIRAHMKALGVPAKPLWECLPVCHENPSPKVQHELIELCADAESVLALQDLYAFRAEPDYDSQHDPSPISEIYFPPFIKHLDDEHFVDCGACDGDTVSPFLLQWKSMNHVTAYEPDEANFAKLKMKFGHLDYVTLWPYAVSDSDGDKFFLSTGDYSAHIGNDGNGYVKCVALDSQTYAPFATYPGRATFPTYIKMDIEGAELEALWGARRIMKEHSPVLAICAYHASEHTWQIPLLIHAIHPDYKLYFRRYAEGAFELVWYAVPCERIII